MAGLLSTQKETPCEDSQSGVSWSARVSVVHFHSANLLFSVYSNHLFCGGLYPHLVSRYSCSCHDCHFRYCSRDCRISVVIEPVMTGVEVVYDVNAVTVDVMAFVFDVVPRVVCTVGDVVVPSFLCIFFSFH